MDVTTPPTQEDPLFQELHPALGWWWKCVDDTWVNIKTEEVENFTKHINAVDDNIKFTREDATENCLAFLDCAGHINEDRRLNIKVYRKPTHTDQYT